MIDWLVTNALAALALATLAGLFIWTFRPAPAVRHALWLVVVLKLVAPGGPTVSLPLPVKPETEEPIAMTSPPAADPVVESEEFTVWVEPKPGQTPEEAAALAVRSPNAAEPTEAPAEPPVASPPRSLDYRPWLLATWVAGAVVIAGRQLRGTVRFARFARQARPAPESLMAEVAAVAGRLGVRVPRVRTLAGLTSPVLWCLGRPVLLWPAGLECRLKGDGRRAVIAHELAHLRRRDHWVRRLEMIASVLHWWNPLFWVARKKLRADAELACDAWAAGQVDRRAYAEALLEVCSFNPRRRPAPAVGVLGEGRRAMQERLTMIMRDRVPCRLAFGAKLVVALMAIAAVPAWTFGQSGRPATNNDVQLFFYDVADKGDADAQTKELEAQIKALAQKLEALKAAKAAEAQKKAAEKVKEAHEKLGEKVHEYRLYSDGKALSVTPAGEGGPVRVLIAGKDGVKVIGPDGKEIKDVKVIIGGQPGATPPVRPQPAGAAPEANRFYLQFGEDAKPMTVTPRWATEVPGHTAYVARATGTAITLSRTTYKLSKEQAAALGTLLGSVKATVMETKVDGDSITVTTTPEVQQAIGQIVRLIQGQGGTFYYRVAPTPANPAKPGAPKPGTTPAAPEKVNVNVILDQLKATGVDPTKVDLNVAIEGALKDAALKQADVDRLRERLKSVTPPKVELRIERPDGQKKPDGEKK